MRTKAILSVSAVVLALFAGAVQATVITRDVTIDLETDGRIIAFSDQDSWEGIVSIEDITFATGDTVLVNIRFANSKSLELSNPGTNPLNSGIELTKLSFRKKTPNVAYDSRASGFFTYVGVDGDLLSNPTYWDINGGIAPFWHSNLTDTSFSYSGINIEINFDPSSINEDHFECLNPPCVFDAIEWSSSAEDVRIVDAAPVNDLTIDAIIAFFDESVSDCSLVGVGKGTWLSKVRLYLMREMLVIAKELLEKEKTEWCLLHAQSCIFKMR